MLKDSSFQLRDLSLIERLRAVTHLSLELLLVIGNVGISVRLLCTFSYFFELFSDVLEILPLV